MASQIDIPADQTKTGGNGFAGIDTVIVRDYETILLQLDEITAMDLYDLANIHGGKTGRDQDLDDQLVARRR